MELKFYSLDYIEDFVNIKNNPSILDNGYDKTPNPYTLKDGEEFFNIQLAQNPAKRFLMLYNSQLAGEIGISIKEDVFRLNAEIGYFVGEPFWGKGLASKAIEKMTEYAFSTFDIVRIMAGVFDFNKASMKALEKNGYYLEAIRKKAVIKNGNIIDDYVWVKLKDND